MQNNWICKTDLLIDQKISDIRPLVATQLDNISLLVLLYRAIAWEILFERLTNPFDVEIVREALHGCDTLAPIALLDANVDFILGRGEGAKVFAVGRARGRRATVAGVFERVWYVARFMKK